MERVRKLQTHRQMRALCEVMSASGTLIVRPVSNAPMVSVRESAADAGAGGDDECANDEDCGRTRGCYEGTCRSRCFNDSVCERQDPGTICMDDPNNRLGLCLPPECERADECPNNHDCNGGRCEEYTPCDNDGQCGAQAFCNDDGRCQDREDCLQDADCEDGQTCNDGFCYDVPSCAEGESCPDGTECVGGNCVDAICRSNDQCADGEVCTAGSCSRPEAIAPDKVLVVTPYGACDSGNAGACRLPLRVGEQVQLHAMALDVNGVGILDCLSHGHLREPPTSLKQVC